MMFTSLCLEGGEEIRIACHTDPHVGVIAAVRLEGLTIQSSNPAALRALATALAEAASRAEAHQPAATVTA